MLHSIYLSNMNCHHLAEFSFYVLHNHRWGRNFWGLQTRSSTFNGSHLLQSCIQLLILVRNMHLGVMLFNIGRIRRAAEFQQSVPL